MIGSFIDCKRYRGSFLLSLNVYIHRCGPGGSMRACHAAGPDSIPGRDRFPGWYARNLGTNTAINGLTIYCVHTDQWSRIRAVAVNATAVISMLNYLLCKSSLASEIAVRDHMYHNKIYLFPCCLPALLIWTNSFGTICIYMGGGALKKRAGGLGTETNTCMSEVLALAVEALVPLRHMAVS